MVSSFYRYVGVNYHSPVITSVNTLRFLIKCVFIYTKFYNALYESIGLHDCSGFLQFESHFQ